MVLSRVIAIVLLPISELPTGERWGPEVVCRAALRGSQPHCGAGRELGRPPSASQATGVAYNR